MIKETETSRANVKASRPSVISFFSGCGGFDLGFSSAGFSVDLAFDVASSAADSYNHNKGEKVCYVADLSRMAPSKIINSYRRQCGHIVPCGVIGGAPCQTFSSGNVHFNKNDPRHALPRRYARLLRSLNNMWDLDFFVFENVRGIASTRHQEEYLSIKGLFEKAGFKLFEGELDAADFGVAQHRRRIFIVGFNSDKYPDIEFSFPEPQTTTPLTVADKLKGLPSPVFFKRGLKHEDISYHPNHWTMRPHSRKFVDGSLKNGRKAGRSFRVLKWNKPSLTVAYGNREIHVHPNTKRRLSVYEAMLLQGFPEDYELLGTLSAQISQVSDAIPPQLGKALGNSIRQVLIDSQ